MTAERKILITGAAGYLGRIVLEELAAAAPQGLRLIAMDVRAVPAAQQRGGVLYLQEDIRSARLAEVFAQHGVQCVIHLAAIVTPGKKSNRALEYAIDVLGTQNVLQACVAASVQRIVVASSGAAYGYHADNPAWLTEVHPLRGNYAFAYSHHKKMVEEMLAQFRSEHPALRQTIFRIGTILGESTNNQITALFDKPRLLMIRGAASPFVFVWDRDVARCIAQALRHECDGIFNLAGDGVLTLREIAAILGKQVFEVPAGLLRVVLAVLKALRLSPYGPEQIDFLRYRPVLDNTKLKTVLGYTPEKSSREVFEFFVASRRAERA